MKRYLLSYLAAYCACLGVFAALLMAALGFWFLTDTPLWFDVLCVIATALPALALGEVFGRRPKAKQVRHTVPALMILLALMGLTGFVGGMSEGLPFLGWPGLLLGSAVKALVGGSGYWDGAFILLGNLMLPLLFHLGWRWGTGEE